MSRTSSRTGLALTALALAVAPLSPLAADQRPDRIALATGRLPEGIAAGPGTTFFVGARSDGDVYVGDVRRDTVTRLVDEPTPGAAAVGMHMHYDDRSGLLWVAGGGPRASRGLGTVTAYDGRREVSSTTIAGAGFLDDVVVTRDAVYVTDSFQAALVVVPLDGRGPPRGTGGTAAPDQDVRFGANGIRELPGGDLVVVSGGRLYAVDPRTGVADRIVVSGARPLSRRRARGPRAHAVHGQRVRRRRGRRAAAVRRRTVGDHDRRHRRATSRAARPAEDGSPRRRLAVRRERQVLRRRAADRALRDARAQALSRAVTRTAECRRARSG